MSDPNAIYSQALSHTLVVKALFDPEPAWVWSTSGENILWSNEAGCRFFNTKSLPDLLSRTFRRVSPATVQIAHMATNTEIGVTIERTLRFFQGMNPITITAQLERILLVDGTEAIFVHATSYKSDKKFRRASKNKTRLMKLFSRGDAPAALLSSKGKIQVASYPFQKEALDEDFLREAVHSLKDERYISRKMPDTNRIIHLCALREEDGSFSKVFATLADAPAMDMADDTKLDANEADEAVDDAIDEITQTEEKTEAAAQEEIVFINDENAHDDNDDNILAVGADVHADKQDGDFTFISKELPTRFLFTLDANQKVTSLSPEISTTLGTQTSDILGKNWADISKQFKMDPTGIIGRKIKRESIWTETIYWPISGTASTDGQTGPLRAPVTMTAMPIFNSEREFEGFRGFGSIETANVTVHHDLDTQEETAIEDAEEINEEWETLLATTPLPSDISLDEPQNPEQEISSGAINYNDNDDHTLLEDEHDSSEDELRWGEDSRTEETTTFLNTYETNIDEDDKKIIPLHSRPIEVKPVHLDHEDTVALSKPEQNAFKQIADALSARLEKDEAQTPKAPEHADTDAAEGNDFTNSDYVDIDFDAASIIEGHVKPSTDEKPASASIDERAAKMLDDVFLPKQSTTQNITSKSSVAKGLGAGAAAILNSGTNKKHDNTEKQNNETAEAVPLESSDQLHEMADLPFENTLSTDDAQAERCSDSISLDAEISATEVLTARDGILNRLPLGLIVSRHRDILFANKSVLDFLGYDDVDAFEAAGGINTLFQADTQADPGSFVGRDMLKHLVIKADQQEGHIPQAVRAKMADGTTAAVDLRLQSGEWQGREALLMALSAKTDAVNVDISDGERMSQLLGQSTDVMDIASDGILIIDETGKLIHANSSAEALFDRDRSQMRGLDMVMLFAEESQKSIRDYLDGLTRNGVASVLNDGREVIGQESSGGLIPLFITIGRLEKNDRFKDGVFCVVLRDITQWKRAEEELIESRRIAENANEQKSDFLASISHEIRTPLNAIIGFSEVMMEQHYGPIENPRYLEYTRDINTSGNHLMSLVNDLLDLSKIEAGKLDLSFSSVFLNPVIQECVALMQPEANRDRIIIRTSLMETIPPVVADARSIRQIALNLLSNAVKFTKAGGQVIVSTTLEENGEVAIRVRDTGIGMSEDDLEYAMQPFRQVQASQNSRKPGTGLGLPLTKALVEANRARFTIDSRVDYGTLIQVIFPNERVLAR